MTSAKKLNILYREYMDNQKSDISYVNYINYRNRYNYIKRRAKMLYYNQQITEYKHESKKIGKL